MKNSIGLMMMFFITIFCSTTNAQTAKKENSLLWEISGKGIEKPSYLYGTIHMICGNDFFMKEKVTKAFEKTSKLALEINMNDAEEMSFMQKSVISETPLTKKLTAEQSKELDEILQKTTGMKLSQVDSFTMMTVMSLIAMKSFGCENLKFYEMEFITKAKALNNTVIGLEKVKDQLDILGNAYTDQEMITMLKDMNKELTSKMVQDYKEENIKNIYSQATDPKMMNKKTQAAMLDNRNINWVSILPELIKKESVFIAVGAGHLPGEKGLISLLTKAGYTVKPILD